MLDKSSLEDRRFRVLHSAELVTHFRQHFEFFELHLVRLDRSMRRCDFFRGGLRKQDLSIFDYFEDVSAIGATDLLK